MRPRQNSVRVQAWTLVLCCGLAATSPASAQNRRWLPPAGLGDVTFLGANTLLGGLTAGILQAVRGGSFSDGFTRGALGGAIVYGGKRLGAARFDGAGLIGRQIGSLGTSMVRNASEGEPFLSSVALPVGPVWLYTGTQTRLHIKPDVRQLIWLGYGLSESALSFDLSRTLSAGAPVFVAHNRRIVSDGDEAYGITGGSTVMLAGRGSPDIEGTFAHERVHVLQGDFYAQAWAAPAETWLLESIGLGTIAEHVNLGFVSVLYWTLSNRLLGNANSFEQLEAGFLGRQ